MKIVVTSFVLDENKLKEFQKEADIMNEEGCSIFEIIYVLSENHNCMASITFEKEVAFIHIS